MCLVAVTAPLRRDDISSAGTECLHHAVDAAGVAMTITIPLPKCPMASLRQSQSTEPTMPVDSATHLITRPFQIPARAALRPLATLALLLAACCVTAPAVAQGAAPASPEALLVAATDAPLAVAQDAGIVFVPPGDPPVPLLWKVSDADNSVYLLGSFHLLKPDDYPLSGDVNAAFAASRDVVFELPPAEMASPQLGVQMAQAALRTDGTTLDSQLPPATVRRLVAWQTDHAAQLQANGLTPQALQGFEPWFVGLMVTITSMTGQGLDPALGLDQHFMAAAAAAGKPVDGFETGAQQIAFLDGMDAIEQMQFLAEALSPSDESGNDVESLHASWRAGDDRTLFDGMGADMKARYPDLYQRINVARNIAWLPKVEALLARPGTDDILVVVGALHLIGSDGIVSRLRAAGYHVERICSACPPELLAEPVPPGEGAEAVPLSSALPPQQ